ncbi:major facilitator superfamily domain-containing protein [Microdochium bolleyi]|uniref:Major facilitator superfamily domain-containing protein n=1 Tax=Microdochium bolleyi TaxID=196109 RepID=A0A136JBU4_9PEZI|nr:major facilitator superfamily domain-containing protein [Microdochium bolleyi]
MERRQREAERALHDQTDILPLGRLLVVLSTLAITLLITFIDQNGIAVTLPTIANDIDAGDTISWAGTSSLIANTTFQMLYGRLSDIFGRKVVFLSATGLLSLAALMCGLSRSPAMFYVFRGVAGIGGGGISNLAMIIVSDIVALEQRGKYQGVLGAMVGLGNVAGPFLAAAFIAGTGSWRGFFFTVCPLAALVGAIAFSMLPSNPRSAGVRESISKIDFAGVLLSSVAVIFLLIPISGGGAYFPWDSPIVISMLIIGAVSLVLFVVVELKIARLPMIPVQMFSNPCVATLLIQSFLLGSVYQSHLYYLPLYLQNAHGFSVVESAGFLSITVSAQAVFSILSGQYISWTKRYGEVIWCGFGTWTLGCGLTLLVTRTTPAPVIAAPLLLIGVGVGFIFQPTLVALQAHVSRDRRAVIISNRNFARCAGGAVGLAASASVLQAVLRAQLPDGFQGLADKSYAGGGEERAVEMVLDAYMAASRGVFILQIPFIGLCLLGCIFLKDRGLGHPEDRGEQGRLGQRSRKGSTLSGGSSGSHDCGGGLGESPLTLEETPWVGRVDTEVLARSNSSQDTRVTA